jgi:flavodoxin
MKNLVVYYSRSGNTETVAQEISKLVDGDVFKIELVKPIGFGWAGFTALAGLRGKIKPLTVNIKAYDNIFIGSPVWAGKSSTPVNTFLHETDFTGKNVFVFITQADFKTPGSVYGSIAKRVEGNGGKVIDTFFIKTDMKNPLTPEQAKEAVSKWTDSIHYDK